jgi:tRNA(Arg) A34 adenosine deaminase TadA
VGVGAVRRTCVDRCLLAVPSWAVARQLGAGLFAVSSATVMPGEAERHLLAAIELARRSRANGNHPFGALLVDANGSVVLEAENTVVTARDCTGHAETNLMRVASERFDSEFLSRCTLYTSTEPCGMCAGAIYWGNVCRVVFALSQEELRRITGGSPENMQLTIRSHEIFARGDHKVQLSGPHLPEQARAVHEGFWD